jgi:transposase
MVYNRLIAPKSELATTQWVKGQYIEGVMEEISLQHYYRSLSRLVQIKRPLEISLYNRLMVFYDLTSTYFEGHSRDHRPDRPQVEIGLLVNRDGIPISHTVFDGNLKDSTTLPQVVEQMRGNFKIKLRPIYHRNDGRVKGHIFICFLAYLLEKLLEKKLEAHGYFISARKALQILEPIKVVISELAGQKIKKVSRIVKEQEEILKALGAGKMPKIVP